MLQKAAVVVIGYLIFGVVAIYLDAIVIGKEILIIVTTLKMLSQNALHPVKKRVHDLGPYLK